jgi:hypothetical protein
VFSGVQLVMLGLVGEYLGRLYLTASGRPQFVVRDIRRPAIPRAGEAEGLAPREPTVPPVTRAV